MEWPPALEWTDENAASGEVFRIGRDVAHRDGDRTLRIEAETALNAEHREAAVAAVRALSERWGGPIALVLDFVGHGPPSPGESVQLCRELMQSGSLERIVLLKKPWMPGFVVAGVTRVLSAVGVPFSLSEST
jgi:hypothetical protein